MNTVQNLEMALIHHDPNSIVQLRVEELLAILDEIAILKQNLGLNK